MMLGLPSTTEVGRRIPKEAFYRSLDLDAKTRDEFVHLVESITVANSIKPSTANIRDGATVHEILVLDVRLKGDGQPRRVIEAIASANPHRLAFRTEPDGTVYVLRKGLRRSDSVDSLVLAGSTLDEAWDSICAQVVFGNVDGTNLDSRIELASKKAVLEAEIAKLDAACWKAKQINKKNELFAQLKAKRRELRELEG